jgi:hypothetical protein
LDLDRALVLSTSSFLLCTSSKFFICSTFSCRFLSSLLTLDTSFSAIKPLQCPIGMQVWKPHALLLASEVLCPLVDLGRQLKFRSRSSWLCRFGRPVFGLQRSQLQLELLFRLEQVHSGGGGGMRVLHGSLGHGWLRPRVGVGEKRVEVLTEGSEVGIREGAT